MFNWPRGRYPLKLLEHKSVFSALYVDIWVRSRNCGCLVTWFCYQLIAKPGNKTATTSWPDWYYPLPSFITWYLWCRFMNCFDTHRIRIQFIAFIAILFLHAISTMDELLFISCANLVLYMEHFLMFSLRVNLLRLICLLLIVTLLNCEAVRS